MFQWKRLKQWCWKRWQQPCGIREVLWVAFPLMISTVSYSLMQFIDRLFLLYHSQMEAGAIVTMGTLVWTLISLPLGAVGYVTAFVAQYRGSDRKSEIGKAVVHAGYLCLASFPLLAIPLFFVESWYLDLGHSPELAAMEGRCFTIYILAGAGMIANGVLEGMMVGLDKNQPVMTANLLATLLNVIIDPILIFGWGWIPEMGIDGACWATAFSMWAKFFYMLWVVGRLPDLAEFHFVGAWGLDFRFLFRFLYFGLPSGFQWFVEGLAMTYFVAVMGRLGDVYLTATSLTFSINMLAFVPIYGLGMGLTAIIGNQLGRNQPQLARRAVSSGLFIAFAYTSVFAFAYLCVPQFLFVFHRVKADDFAILEPVVMQFVFYVAIYCLLDALQIVMVSVLKGAGDTWFVSFAILSSSLIFLSGGRYLESSTADVGLQAERWWFALTLWLGGLAIAYTARVLHGRWESMRVIEPQL